MDNKKVILIVFIVVILLVIFINFNSSSFTSTPVLNYTAIIVGTARDISPFVEKNIPKLQKIAKLFNYCPIVVYENDSKDNTLELLKKFPITVITETNVKGNRTTRLAHGRNVLHDYAISLNYPFDYYIVCDLDDKIEKLTPDSILSCFKYSGWSMMGANQQHSYYDLWALRTKDTWCNLDCWNNIKGIMGCESKYIPSDSDPIPVDSCFGGTGIYRFKDTLGCRYSSFPQEFSEEICEHVPFHQSMRELHGAQLFINPGMINS